MFTGLVDNTGIVRSFSLRNGSGELVIETDRPYEHLQYGESIAVNGCCLTLEKELSPTHLVFHTLEETLRRTNLAQSSIRVNLERAMMLGGRMGGHIVSGHIDGVGCLRAVRPAGSDYELEVSLPAGLGDFLVEKGSIAIDGISLTLIDVWPDSFTVQIIPVTWKETALSHRKIGDSVNLETDLIGKYVVKMMRSAGNFQSTPRTSAITMEKLAEAGFLD